MKVSLLGVEFNSPNRGCGALAYSICQILRKMSREKKENLSVVAVLFDVTPIPEGILDDVKIKYIKNQPKKLSFWKLCYKEFKSSDVVLDFSMGDSFADIYGKKRFLLASMLKKLAMMSGTKFVMAPQTIGPFSNKMMSRVAKHILKKCDLCFVRDSLSEEYTYKLCGRRPLLTTDVAFELSYKKDAFERSDKRRIGFNPSGLLWTGTKDFVASKHLIVDYREYVRRVFEVWSQEEVELYLIPHVFTQNGGGMEDDLRACKEIQEMFPKTKIVSEYATPMDAKGFIATLDVFVGARMHATVGAFSSGVATIPFSYSRKFEGLFYDLEYPYLVEATTINTEEAVERTLQWVKEYVKLRDQVVVSTKLLSKKQVVFYDSLFDVIKD
ncbi:MAG: polysaccharide pyruvyl transferase family protein [Lachnospiraceae bacterium]|nr:polysaccharide pyruvyl transferase family protein [Lachnospiraceae bacterium]